MKVKTTRFGELQVNQDDILIFADGILGFENQNKFFVVDPGDSTLILWLQSVEDGSVAFPIIEPKIFKSDYVAKLLPADMSSIDLEESSQAKIYTILTIPKDITQMSANLKAPIVINNSNKKAKQVVLQDSKLSVKHEMYLDLKRYIVSYFSDDSKRTNVESPKVETPSSSTAEKSNPSTTASAKELN